MNEATKKAIVSEFDEMSIILDAIHSSEKKNWYRVSEEHLDNLRRNNTLNESQYEQLRGQLKYMASSLILQIMDRKSRNVSL